jgi:uncharacterized protein (TIGR03118 family)
VKTSAGVRAGPIARRSARKEVRMPRGPSLRSLGILAAITALALSGASAAEAHGGTVYKKRNLVSDIDGVARITDPNLVNPWGLSAGPATPLWVADNGTDKSTLYSGGIRRSIPMIVPLVVDITDGAPTGTVFNPTDGFPVGGSPSRFIFDSEAGTITAWNMAAGTTAQTVVPNSGAVYKGLALAGTGKDALLYAADFTEFKINVFDSSFKPVTAPGGFVDPNLPKGYGPFNVQELAGRIVVAYAQVDPATGDEVAGDGKGFVDVYDTSGHLLHRLISNGKLNAPWGLVLAPHHFGQFSGDLLVGNFGDGTINAYDPRSGQFEGTLTNKDGNPIKVNGLWGLRFGNGVFGTPTTLVFSAGIGDEDHGLLGEIVVQGSGD